MGSHYQPSQTRTKVRLPGNQARDEISLRWEVVKVAGVNVNALIGEQGESEFLVRVRRRNEQNCVPATFHIETATNFLQSELPVQLREIPPDPIHQLVLKGTALQEKGWHRQLHRSIHREVGVRDDFEPRERFAFQLLRSADHQPGSLHLRESANLG